MGQFFVRLFLTAALLVSVTLAPPAWGASTDRYEPPLDEHDWIQLNSEEWLKGELISLHDDELIFDSDALGLLTLDWEDVRLFRGHGQHRISLSGLRTASGELRIEDDQVSLVTQDGSLETSRVELVSITPPAQRELDNWSGNLVFGFGTRQGNTESTEFNLLASTRRRTPTSRIRLDYLGNYNETEGEEVANNHRLNFTWDLFRGGRLFWRPLFGQYLRDVIQNIDHQVTVETGLGFELIKNPRTEWDVSGGVGFNTVRYRSVGMDEDQTISSPALSLGTDFETELTPWLDYLFQFNMTLLDEDSGRYQHHLITTLSSDLVRDWDLDVSFVWDRVQRPQERADGTVPEQDDYRLIVGLGYDF